MSSAIIFKNGRFCIKNQTTYDYANSLELLSSKTEVGEALKILPASALKNDKSIFVYTDESGNTGQNIFDSSQPYFYTASLISEIDLDTNIFTEFDEWKSILDVTELHGNELGYYRLEKISDKIKDFLLRNNLIFIFTRIEKEHISSMKLVDTILDSGLNMAVSPLHYSHRYFRLSMALAIDFFLSPKNRKKFWDVYNKVDHKGLQDILSNLIWNIDRKLKDPRQKQLLLDALNWAMKYPEKVLDYRRDNLDTPNMVAFGLIIQGLHRFLQRSGGRVKKFIHDEQSQFAKYMKFMYTSFKELSISMDDFSWITDIEPIDLYDCKLEFKSSSSSFGLQIVDICLWLVKRYFVDKDLSSSLNNCTLLLNYLKESSLISDFTREALENYYAEATLKIFQKPLSQEDLKKGKEIVNQVEEHRINRMNQNPE